jgi:hypothetical protein
VGRGGLMSWGGLASRGGLVGCGGLVGRGVRCTVRSALRGAVRGAGAGLGLCARLQSRATAAATLLRAWILESQKSRAVGQIVVRGGRVGTALEYILVEIRYCLDVVSLDLTWNNSWRLQGSTSNVWSFVLRMRSPWLISSDQVTLVLDLPAKGVLSKPDSSVKLPLRLVAVNDLK